MSPQADTTPDTAPDSSCTPTRPPSGHEPAVAHRHRSEPITIEYETFGDPGDPAVLLVMGFGTQLLGWDADFCRMLAARGRYVIRYDNRDCGLSTKLDEHPVHLGDFITAVTSGDVRPRARDGAVLAAGHGRRRHRRARRGSASPGLTWSGPRWAA